MRGVSCHNDRMHCNAGCRIGLIMFMEDDEEWGLLASYLASCIDSVANTVVPPAHIDPPYTRISPRILAPTKCSGSF